MIRFIYLFNYTEGISLNAGENWYLHEHVLQVNRLPGLVRHRSWRQVDVSIPYPSAGAPTPFGQFVRRTELCFDSFESAIKSVRENEHLWKPSSTDKPGFREIECLFLEEEPQYDLLRDAPPEQYKYMTLPLHWPKGRPEVDDSADIFINSYCIAYDPVIGFANGEDWYLGHHTREGKQLPGIKHYKTWKVIPVSGFSGSILQPNKWVRLTELGMSPDAYKATMVNEDTRIRFAASPHGNVLSGWLNISIKLDQVEELGAEHHV